MVSACKFPCGGEVPCGISLFGLFCYGKESFEN